MAHAVPFENIENKPLVSIVLDDMGLNQFHSDWAVSLKAPLTLSYLPYAKNLANQTQSARAEGHELLIHLPMEPRGTADPGPGALMVNMDQMEIKKRLARALYVFPGAIGVNNHMGSLFTADQRVMSIVLTQIKSSGQLFLDSLTTSNSLVAQLGDKLNVPVVSRDVFLDDNDKEDEIVRRLREVERVALDKGTAIAIGHPRLTTLRVLEKWLANLAEKNKAAPLSAVAKKRLKNVKKWSFKLNNSKDFQWKCLGFRELNSHQLHQILKMRQQIFIIEQKCIYEDIDEFDIVSQHIQAINNGKLLAYCRVLPASLCMRKCLSDAFCFKNHRNRG